MWALDFHFFYEGVDTVFVHTLLTMSPGDQDIFSLLVCQSLSGSCPIYFLNILFPLGIKSIWKTLRRGDVTTCSLTYKPVLCRTWNILSKILNPWNRARDLEHYFLPPTPVGEFSSINSSVYDSLMLIFPVKTRLLFQILQCLNGKKLGSGNPNY